MKEVFAYSPAVKLMDAVVRVFEGTEEESYGFSYTRYYKQTGIETEWKKMPPGEAGGETDGQKADERCLFLCIFTGARDGSFFRCPASGRSCRMQAILERERQVRVCGFQDTGHYGGDRRGYHESLHGTF